MSRYFKRKSPFFNDAYAVEICDGANFWIFPDGRRVENTRDPIWTLDDAKQFLVSDLWIEISKEEAYNSKRSSNDIPQTATEAW